MTDQAQDDGAPRWLIVEIFGHRQHAGRCSEEERLGVKMLRIDEPRIPFGQIDKAEIQWTTHWYAGASIFSIRETTEESVMRLIGAKPRPAIVDLTRDREEAATCPECGGVSRDCGRLTCPQAHHEPAKDLRANCLVCDRGPDDPKPYDDPKCPWGED